MFRNRRYRSYTIHLWDLMRQNDVRVGLLSYFVKLPEAPTGNQTQCGWMPIALQVEGSIRWVPSQSCLDSPPATTVCQQRILSWQLFLDQPADFLPKAHALLRGFGYIPVTLIYLPENPTASQTARPRESNVNNWHYSWYYCQQSHHCV